MTTTHRMHLALWATFAAVVGLLSTLLVRGMSLCQVDINETTLAEQSPLTWWLFIVLAVFCFGLALGGLAIARLRSDQAACPHCGKPVEPRVTMLGQLTLVPPAPPVPPAP
jgi:hypothetical protein